MDAQRVDQVLARIDRSGGDLVDRKVGVELDRGLLSVRVVVGVVVWLMPYVIALGTRSGPSYPGLFTKLLISWQAQTRSVV